MITLYELRWSHYCEKVRLALDYMGLPWRAVGVDAFRKDPLKAHPLPPHLPNHTVPAIHDDATGRFVMDSTPILRYLADAYPEAPGLFPADGAGRKAMDARLLEMDSALGIPARRFGYLQVILECPDLLSDLFLSHRANGFFSRRGIRRVAGAVLGMLLAKRFEFHKTEKLGLYEATERHLLRLAAEGAGNGDDGPLSAADLTLAAYMRPLTIVPFFSEHPELAPLFAHSKQVLARLGHDAPSAYQEAIQQARKRHPPVRRRTRKGEGSMPFLPKDEVAANDQRPVWCWGLIKTPFHYFVSIRRGRFRRAEATEGMR